MLNKNLFMKERLEGLLTSLEFTSGESVGKFTGLSDSWLPTQRVEVVLSGPTSCNVATVTIYISKNAPEQSSHMAFRPEDTMSC